ncbi:MAG: ATP-binding cassette subfamily B multidrug efflux pump [Sphingobacteriales bacterium]
MKHLAYLNKYLYKYRGRLLLGVFFICISNIFGLFPPQVIRYALNLIEHNIYLYGLFDGFEQQSAFYSLFTSALLLFGALVLTMAVMKGIFMFFMRQTIIVVSRFIEYDLKNEIFRHYQDLSLSFFRRNSTGDLMNRVTEDVNRVRMYLGPAIMYTFNLTMLFTMVISVMLSVNPKLTFFALLPLPILAIIIYNVNNIINRKSERIQSQLSTLSTYVQEAFSGIRVLKAYGKEKQSQQDFAVQADIYRDRSLSLAKVQALFFPTMLLLIGLSTTLTIYIGGIEVINGNISAGNIAEFIVYVGMLTWPVMSLGWVSSLVQRASASQERINEFLHTETEIVSGLQEAPNLQGSIKFENVSFKYPDTGITALKNVSFEIKPGEMVAIIGRTGSGKSTIANLLTRMYDVTEGRLLLDEVNIKLLRLEDIRSQIACVPQEVFLFSDTIHNNIAFGTGEISRAEVEQAAKNAMVHTNISEFPKGYNTRVGERGITLSGGQKQRVSISRALAKTSPILLFDDCLSAVDTKTEEGILNNLGRIMKGKTTILISHRVSTIKNADKIIVLDDGKLIEQGKHSELMKENGAYKQLYDIQLLEEEINA